MSRADALSFGHVALVVGGDSAEREVSLRGGKAIAKALENLGVQFSVVDGPRRLLEQVAAGHYDRVFNLLHGRGGEDGALQGALRIYGIPVTRYSGCSGRPDHRTGISREKEDLKARILREEQTEHASSGEPDSDL